MFHVTSRGEKQVAFIQKSSAKATETCGCNSVDCCEDGAQWDALSVDAASREGATAIVASFFGILL